MWVEAVAATGSCLGRYNIEFYWILCFVFYCAPHQGSGGMSVEATLIVFFASQKLHQVGGRIHPRKKEIAVFHVTFSTFRNTITVWQALPSSHCPSDLLYQLVMVDITEIPWIYHCMFVWHCIGACCNLPFLVSWNFSPFQQPVASSWKSHQRSKWWWSQGKGSGWGCLRIIGTYNIHTYTQGFAESTKTKFPMVFTRTCCFWNTNLHYRWTYTNNIHQNTQSSPASTESFVCRVIGSLKFVPLRCPTNRATGKSASNQATMVQHVNTAQNGHDLQQLPKHSVCVTVRQA